MVSDGKIQGVVQASFRVHASLAWSFPSLELRSAKAWPVVCLDCDGTTGYSRLMLAVEDREIPCPNWVVHRDSGGAHGARCLARPVLFGAGTRARPLRLLSRAAEYMAQKVEADPGYGRVLSHNPMTPEPSQRLQTDWRRRQPYSLQELAEIVPFGWRRPAVARTEAGRNYDMFRALLKWAGSPDNIDLPVLPAAMAIYRKVLEAYPGADHPFTVAEVQGISRSVERYRRGWIARGQFSESGDRERSAWGQAQSVRSGQARRKRTEARDRSIVRDRVAGMSIRAIASKHGVTHPLTLYVVGRDAPLLLEGGK